MGFVGALLRCGVRMGGVGVIGGGQDARRPPTHSLAHRALGPKGFLRRIIIFVSVALELRSSGLGEGLASHSALDGAFGEAEHG